MSTLSVPLPPNLEKFVERKVKEGYAENKASVIRKALKSLQERDLIETIRESEEDIREGRVFYDDLEKIAKKFRS